MSRVVHVQCSLSNPSLLDSYILGLNLDSYTITYEAIVPESFRSLFGTDLRTFFLTLPLRTLPTSITTALETKLQEMNQKHMLVCLFQDTLLPLKYKPLWYGINILQEVWGKIIKFFWYLHIWVLYLIYFYLPFPQTNSSLVPSAL